MSALYEAIVLERVKQPRHAGRPARFDAQGQGANRLCGDKVSVYLTRDGMEVSHDSEGCAIMVASADLMADAARGKTPMEIKEIFEAFTSAVTTGSNNPALGELNALTAVSEFPSRIGCATLPWRALEEALQNV
jgi:nitrogen fixation NifU-like protein